VVFRTAELIDSHKIGLRENNVMKEWKMLTVIAVPTRTAAVRSLSFSILKLLISNIRKTYMK